MNETLAAFKAYTDKIWAITGGVTSIYWDNLTGASKGGLRTRGKAMAIMSQIAAEMKASPEMKAFLEALEPQAAKGELDDASAACVREARRSYDQLKNVPPELVREVQEHFTKAEAVWEDAKGGNDYAKFAPYLKKNFEYAEKLAKLAKPEIAAKSVYNALLDDYEPDLTTDDLDPFFAALKACIIPLTRKVTESKFQVDRSVAERLVPAKAQEAVVYKLAEIIGFDINRGAIKESEHPFTTGLSKFDTRFTTHYYENNFLSSLFSTLHEGGHGIYEQGKRDDIAESILDDGVSMAIHESQSRFYENIIGRGKAFWDYAWPVIKPLLGENYENVTAEEIYLAANAAKPSLIRIEADELTYALHIIIRYEIERDIFAKGAANFDISALPAIWNAKYKEYLGVDVPDDARGVLQDTHWSSGLAGYFPTYALGSAYGAQLLHYMNREFDVDAAVSSGDIAKITAWLNGHIHQYGRIYKPKDLFKKIAGEEPDPKYFTDYLTKKYSEIYRLQ